MTNLPEGQQDDRQKDPMADLLQSVREELSDDYYYRAYAFLSQQGLPDFEGRVPVEVWTAILQAIADTSGYSIVLEAEVLEPTERADVYTSVGHKVIVRCSPTLFLIDLASDPGFCPEGDTHAA
jgi:uncharacterized LabA/DUF88 family protein